MADKLEDVKSKASDLIDNAGSRLDSDVKALREDIGKLAASVSELMKAQATTVSELMKTQATTAKSTVVEMMGDTRDRVADHASDARERVSVATADLEAAIERNPLIAIVAALIAGLFVGVLSRPRR